MPRLIGATAALIEMITASRGAALICLILVFLGAGVFGTWGAKIKIDTNLTALLPKDAPSVRALDELKARKGSTEMFTLAVEADDDEQRERLIEAFAEEIRSWPETRELYTSRDYTPLRDRALYFLETEQLEELRDEMLAERKKAAAKSVAAGVGIGIAPIDAAAVLVGEDDWDSDFEDEDEDPGSENESESESESAGSKTPISFADWFSKQKTRIADQSPLSEREIDLIWPQHDDAGSLIWQDSVSRPYLSKDGRVQVIKATLSNPPTDIKFAKALSERITARIAKADREGLMRGARVQVVSAYNVSREINVILRDAKRASIVSGLAVILVVALGFRHLRSLVLVLLPMLAATGYTLALARVLVGELNALTVFLFAVLFGMGVDFAVHLHMLRRHDPRGSWRSIVESHLRPLASTMVTTSGALGILLLAEFKAFREFGMISAVGVLLCFICALLIVPALDTLLPSRKAPQAPAARESSIRAAPPSESEAPAKIRHARWLVLLAIAGLAAYGAPQIEFEKDLRQLTTPRDKDGGITYSSATGRCSKSTTLVAETDKALAEVVKRFEAARDSDAKLVGGGPMPAGKTEADRKRFVRDVYSLSTLMPEDQPEKARVLAQIAEQANDALAELDPDKAADDERRTHLEALERLARATPLSPTELPDWARKPFVERDGRENRLAHLCIRVNSKHLDGLVAASVRLDVLIGDEPVLRADSRLVFADLISSMQRDAKRLPVWALGIIFIFILLDLRKLKDAVACFSVLGLGLGLAVAVMGLWPLHINFFNLVVMPAVIGLSIDASIHLWHARGQETASATGRASLIAAMTTIAGFAGLLFARHPGLKSIGEVGVTCVALCVGVAFLALYRRPDR